MQIVLKQGKKEAPEKISKIRGVWCDAGRVHTTHLEFWRSFPGLLFYQSLSTIIIFIYFTILNNQTSTLWYRTKLKGQDEKFGL